MAKVERGNVVLTVKDDEVQRYLLLGYNLTDEKGKVLKAAIPTDFKSLQKAYVDNTQKIAELEDTIAKLTAELNAVKTPAKAREVSKAEKAPAAKASSKKTTK